MHFSALFRMICDNLGVQNLTVVSEGAGMGHQWNAIKLDGRWLFVDLTGEYAFKNILKDEAFSYDSDRFFCIEPREYYEGWIFNGFNNFFSRKELEAGAMDPSVENILKFKVRNIK